MSSNLKVNSLVPATGTAIGIGTTGGSIDFRCPATFGGNVTIGGTLTYDEVINIDSIGIVTARTGLHAKDDSTFYGVTSGRNVVWDKSENSLEFGDYTYAKFGVDEDLSIFSQNTLSVINNKTGELRIPSAGNVRILKRHDGSGAFAGELANFKVDGAVELFNAGNKKFETTNTGVVVTGILTATSFKGDGSALTGITQTTINNNANNRIVTGSGTANTLEAETTLEWNGTNTLTAVNQGSGYPDFIFTIKTVAGGGESERFRVGNGPFRINNTNYSQNSDADALVLGTTSGDRGITIVSGNSNEGNIFFGDDGDNDIGKLQYVHSDNSMRFTTNTGERVRIDSSGRLLVGHTSTVDTSTYNSKIQVMAADATASITVGRFGDNGSSTSINLSKSRATSVGSHTNGDLHNDDPIGSIFWWGSDGSDYEEVARITGEADAAFTGSSTPGALTFHTTAVNATTATERLRIDSTGRMTQNGTTSADTASALTLKNGVSGNDHTILELISDPNQYSMIYMGASDDRYKGQIRYKDNDHFMDFRTNGSDRLRIDSNGHISPSADNAQDLGSSSKRWRNLYTTDLHLSNEGGENEVDGTWGDWTLQEGENKIFMINNRTGKKYSLKMEKE